MPAKTLSQSALDVIDLFQNLTIGNKSVRCPYFNNRRNKLRAALRVLVGKGSPKEIAEEAHIISLKEKKNLKRLNEEELTIFLVDHNLGIDCSAFVYYILDAELKAQRKSGMRNAVSAQSSFNPLRKIIQNIRHIENINVAALAHDKNSTEVKLKDVQPGDMVVMLDAGQNHDRDHVLLVYKVDYANDLPKKVYYAHTFQWSTEGKYNHGVRTGTIEITDAKGKLLDQNWTEKRKAGKENETFVHAGSAKKLVLKRLHKLS